jgi:putative ABC transport system ATP-binding protein
MEILQGLNEKGLTIVLVTHEHDIAQFAKRVLVFRDGKNRKDDLVGNRPRELCRRSKTELRFAADANV